jgi:DNA-binding Lrp family transcriptional regulator
MTNIEEKVINIIQTDLFIDNNIFDNLASELNIKTTLLFEILNKYKRNQIIRNISAILNIKQAGYISTLAAFNLPENKLADAIKIINSHPGVSHNYLRSHNYNIWFTIIQPKGNNLKQEISSIAQKTKARDFILLPEIARLKLRVFTPLNEKDFSSRNNTMDIDKPGKEYKLTRLEIEILKIIQKDLPLVKNPFDFLLTKSSLNITRDQFAETINTLKEKNIIRRYSAILNQQTAGYKNNALVTWKANQKDLLALKKICSQFNEISHAYLRETTPGKWEYPLFTMIHAQTSSKLDYIIQNFRKNSGLKEYLVLHSLKEYKKQPIKYFSDRFNNLT